MYIKINAIMKKKKTFIKISVIDDCDNVVCSSLVNASCGKFILYKFVFLLAHAFPTNYDIRVDKVCS